MQDREQIEKTKVGFSVEGILRARQRTWDALNEIHRRIKVGMKEEEGLAIANHTLVEMGAEKRWHRSYVRFGTNTLMPYGTPSQPNLVLGADDIFFIDIGPVWEGYEGDVGATFVMGNDPERLRCASDAKLLWGQVRNAWEQGEPTGGSLYEYAINAAAHLGWKLNLVESNGHRLSDFPHALYHRGAIQELDFKPAPHRWVLEIQIRHPEKEFGAFYEDLLV